MLVDALDLPSNYLVEADVCVVGGGPAGITIALELAKSGRTVALLESGGPRYEPPTQALYVGQESGTLIGEKSAYLASSRLRYLGGTTNHWQGWCRPVDPEILTPREWVDPDGWPLRRDDLSAHYSRAADYARISPFNYRNAELDQPRRRFLFAPTADFETVFFHISDPVRFGVHYRPALQSTPGLTTYLHANLTQIETGQNGSHVTGLEMARIDGSRFSARAGQYVLAAGAVENARLLLASNRVRANGLGNEHDLVGRYFMDHPILRAGFLVATSPQRSVNRYKRFTLGRRGHKARGVLRPNWETQERLRLPGALIVLETVATSDLPPLGDEMAQTSLDMTRLEIGDDALTRRRVEPLAVRVVIEPIPRASSRVRLADEKDALGMPRSALDWELSNADAENLRRVSDHFAHEVSWRHRGRVQLRIDEGDVWGLGSWSNHSMGTTRMHDDPKKGVVDRHCRVHGLDNLHIAGASVFPTVGPSNPTFTLLALAIRLAERLSAE